MRRAVALLLFCDAGAAAHGIFTNGLNLFPGKPLVPDGRQQAKRRNHIETKATVEGAFLTNQKMGLTNKKWGIS